MDKKEAANAMLSARLGSLSEAPERAWEQYLSVYAAQCFHDVPPGEVDLWKQEWRALLATERLKRQVAKATRPVTVRKRPVRLPRRRRRDLQLELLHGQVRDFYKAKLSQQEICRRLGTQPRPPGVQWRDLSWPVAYRDAGYGACVKKWLTAASKAR
jgi:hypothetical protein